MTSTRLPHRRRAWRSGGSRRFAPGGPPGPARRTERPMRVIDSHTEGEPTRVIVDGGPPLGDGPLVERRARFEAEFDHFRRFAVNEPRGHDAIVGALLCEPHDPSCAAGVIFFNNVGYIG